MSRMSFPFARCLGAMLAFAACAAGPATARVSSPNLLHNPGFEESLPGHPWMPTGWDTARARLPTVYFGRDTLAPHSGSYSASVASASALYPLPYNWSQALLVNHNLWGKDLVFSVWTRSFGIEGRAYIKLDAYRDTVSKMSLVWKVDRDAAAKTLHVLAVDDPSIDLGWKRLFFSEPETDWVRREVRLFLPPTVDVVFIRCGLFGTGQLMIDDASLTAEPAQPAPDPGLDTNMMADPGFDGNGNAWEYSLPPYAGMKAERDEAVYHSGHSALGMSSPPTGIVQGTAAVGQVFCNRGLAGKRVRFSGFIKTDSLHSNAFLRLACHTPQGVVQNTSPGAFSGTMDWSEASLELDIPPDACSLWAWLSYTAPVQGRVYFDDISLTVIGKASKK